jgi:hypothetical protein
MSASETDDVLDLVLVPRAGLTVVPVHDELVLYDRTGDGTLHRLDPRAALVWQLLDGTATVRTSARSSHITCRAPQPTTSRSTSTTRNSWTAS